MPEPEPEGLPRPAPAPSWRDRLDLISGGASPALSPPQLALAGMALAALLALGWFLLREPTGPPLESTLPMAGAAGGPASTSTTAPEVVVVHAAGAVASPGVYRLPPGSRVVDVLTAAGGAVGDADLHRLNLAAPVADGSQVYVPRAGEAPPAVAGGTASSSSGAPSGPLDLNTATLEQLEELPGIGPSTAQAILQERERRGRFGSVEELLDVRGIGEAKLDAIRDLVTV